MEVVLDIAQNGSIRGMCVDGVDFFSVLDFVTYVCPGRGPTYARQLWGRMISKNKSWHTECRHLQFKGRSQRKTPCVSLLVLQKVLLMLGSKAAVDFHDRVLDYRKTKLACISCSDWPDWRHGLHQYDGHCYRCFCEKFPTHEKVITKLRVEQQVRAFIDTHFQDFVHDKPMHTAHCDCIHRRRVDHRRVVGNTLLCIETDEHAHRGYDTEDDQARYHDLILAWGGKLVFVRFNPDGKGPPLEERLERLRAEITRHIGRLERGENTSYLEVYYLYYPEDTPDFYEEEQAPECLEAGT